MYFFYENLNVLHRVDYNFPFWHLYQIYTFNNNLNDEEMIASHLMCVVKLLFYDKNIMFERIKQ